MEGAAGRVGRRGSVRVVLWVDIPGQGILRMKFGRGEAPIPWNCVKARYKATACARMRLRSLPSGRKQ